MSYNLKPGPKRIAKSTGEPDKRQRDNKNTPGNTDSLKPSKSSKKNVFNINVKKSKFKIELWN